MISTSAPSRCQKLDKAATAASGALAGGVRMHQRPWNSVAKPASGPLFSVPATGCAGMIVACGRAAANASATLCLQLPTSLTMASVGRSAAMVSATGPIAPTGTQRMTNPALITAMPTVSATSSQKPRSRERSRTSGSASNPVTRTSGIAAFTARATEEPIRPSPMIETRAKGSISCAVPKSCAARR